MPRPVAQALGDDDPRRGGRAHVQRHLHLQRIPGADAAARARGAASHPVVSARSSAFSAFSAAAPPRKMDTASPSARSCAPAAGMSHATHQARRPHPQARPSPVAAHWVQLPALAASARLWNPLAIPASRHDRRSVQRICGGSPTAFPGPILNRPAEPREGKAPYLHHTAFLERRHRQHQHSNNSPGRAQAARIGRPTGQRPKPRLATPAAMVKALAGTPAHRDTRPAHDPKLPGTTIGLVDNGQDRPAQAGPPARPIEAARRCFSSRFGLRFSAPHAQQRRGDYGRETALAIWAQSVASTRGLPLPEGIIALNRGTSAWCCPASIQQRLLTLRCAPNARGVRRASGRRRAFRRRHWPDRS